MKTLCLAILWFSPVSFLSAAEKPLPVKVFILAGQSNMEGQAVVDLKGKDYNEGRGTLVQLMEDPAKTKVYAHLKNADGRWKVRDDVWVRYQRENRPLLAGPLAFGFSVYGDVHHFGPELQFGHILGDHFENPVLLVKTAWGGKSLYQDFRPPSSKGEVGKYYTLMIAQVREALANLEQDFPATKGRGYELAGFVWYHGWNDGVNPKTAVPEYEQNLANLINDVRAEFKTPALPVVIGELTGPWAPAPGEWNTLRKAQAAAAARPEFAGNVKFVPTHEFVRKPEQSPNPTHGHHEFGNAETYFLVGDALGKGMASLMVAAQDSKPPAGFQAIFNGRDLSGWYGLNPHEGTKLEGDKKEAFLKQQREEFSKHWTTENGELVNNGTGPYATTEREYGDVELHIEYKTVAKADSGVYLRGTPQVQIWDWHQVFDPKRPTRRPFLGSGGLFNNTPGTPGRDPLTLADRPFGEWNQFRIRQIGARTWVWLNDKLVVDDAVLENFWDREKPLPAKGPVMLQTHGGEIRWRNIWVRELTSEDSKKLLTEVEADAKARLASALTLHASFDKDLQADFAKGDKACYVQQGQELIKAEPTSDVKLVPDGRFGGALHFTKKNNFRPSYKDGGTLGYNDKNWNATVSVWLRLDPDKDLEPGYCDPLQIVGDDNKQGFIFLEWSKDETPRFFRYAIRPLFPIWNPDNVQWADIPFNKRPMVQVERAPFARDKWTHAVFTLENVNDKTKPQAGRLYLNGKLQGAIENWELTFGWKPERVLLVLGAAYVGHLDDLAVFNRALSPGEVQRLYELPKGVAELR